MKLLRYGLPGQEKPGILLGDDEIRDLSTIIPDLAGESLMAVPAEPVIFMKATSSICGPDDGIVIPRGSKKTDWEVELGVIIGKPGKDVEEAEGLSDRKR